MDKINGVYCLRLFCLKLFGTGSDIKKLENNTSRLSGITKSNLYINIHHEVTLPKMEQT